jgi:cation-transporting ATPase 13A1
VESQLVFAGFLVFHCPLKADAVETLKMLADSSHRVCIAMISGVIYPLMLLCSA